MAYSTSHFLDQVGISFCNVKVYTESNAVVPTANKPTAEIMTRLSSLLNTRACSPDLQSVAVTSPPSDRVEWTLHWTIPLRELFSDNDHNASCEPIEANT